MLDLIVPTIKKTCSFFCSVINCYIRTFDDVGGHMPLPLWTAEAGALWGRSALGRSALGRSLVPMRGIVKEGGRSGVGDRRTRRRRGGGTSLGIGPWSKSLRLRDSRNRLRGSRNRLCIEASFSSVEAPGWGLISMFDAGQPHSYWLRPSDTQRSFLREWPCEAG